MKRREKVRMFVASKDIVKGESNSTIHDGES